MAKKKGHIFSERTRKRNAQMETAEYFEKEVLPKILDKSDIRSLSNSEIKGMRKYLKEQQKKIQFQIDLVQGSGETSGTYESVNKAIDERLTTRRIYTNDPKRLLEEMYRQQQFWNEYEVDDDYYYERSKGTFDKLLGDFDVEETLKYMDDDEQFASLALQEQAMEEGSGIDINDKWTILRRLAAINPRLNVDRAYASQTLKDIENAIESGRWSDINEITANFMESFKAESEIDKNWDVSLKSFTDRVLMQNRGFHGVKKALRKYASSIDNFEPVWASPYNVRQSAYHDQDLGVPF